LLIGSAIVMAVLGLAASFVPREILIALNVRPDPLPVLLVQITGALYLGFAMLNWMARGSLIGGIYGRPVAFGNFLHLMVVALAMLKALIAGPRPPMIIVGACVYWLLCLGFGWVLFTPPRGVVRQGE
jgi:hypothetical protein